MPTLRSEKPPASNEHERFHFCRHRAYRPRHPLPVYPTPLWQAGQRGHLRSEGRPSLQGLVDYFNGPGANANSGLKKISAERSITFLLDALPQMPLPQKREVRQLPPPPPYPRPMLIPFARSDRDFRPGRAR